VGGRRGGFPDIRDPDGALSWYDVTFEAEREQVLVDLKRRVEPFASLMVVRRRL
jgi:hypothetical protein